MLLHSYLVRSRHGIFYLRYQRNGIDRRFSLKTKDFQVASSIAYHFGSQMSKDNFDLFRKLLSNGSTFGLELRDKDFYLKTDGSQTDNEAGLKAYQAHLENQKRHLNPSPPLSTPSHVNAISLSKALHEYFVHLDKQTKVAKKSRGMAKSTLLEMSEIFGSDFPLIQLDDVAIEKVWVKYCQEIKKNELTTIKRNLSFIKKFADWANKPAQNYLNKKITFTIEGAKSESWEYWEKDELALIIDNLMHVEDAWQFWIPLIGLYTGARIGEIPAMKVSDIYVKSGLDIMFLPGTKTEKSAREIPIHSDLIQIGLLEYANNRRHLKKEMLFDITVSESNGFGGNVSKWFSRYIDNLGITDEFKSFSSFRHTITDHLNQMDSNFDANCQYTGHSKGGGVKGQIYGRKLLSLVILKQHTIDKIDWLNYCGWSPSISDLSIKAKQFIK